MKKISLVFIAFFALFAGVAQAANTPFVPQQGKEYVVLDHPESSTKQVTEFFSFYCPHCYDFEIRFKIPEQIQEKMPKGTEFKQFHVNFLGSEKDGGNAEQLTQAWALAMLSGKQNELEIPIFQAVRNNDIHSMADIRKVFLKHGFTAKQFDADINSFPVKALASTQTNEFKTFKVRGVPDFIINQHYRINIQGFSDVKSEKEFVQRYVDTVLYLLNK